MAAAYLSDEVLKVLSECKLTVEEALLQPIEMLAKRQKLGPERARWLLNALCGAVMATTASPVGINPGIRSLTDVSADLRCNSTTVTTRVPALDELMRGLVSGEITEIVGPSASGKTQLCLQLAATAALHGFGVAFVDTAQSFSVQRLVGMHAAWTADAAADPPAKRRRLSSPNGHAGDAAHIGDGNADAARDTKQPDALPTASEMLSRISCFKAFSLMKLMDVIQRLRQRLNDQHDLAAARLRVIVIDSMSAVVSSVLGGQRPDGHALMTTTIRALKAMAAQHNLVVVMTGHTVASGFGGAAASTLQDVKAALGESWTFAADTRIVLSPQHTHGDALAPSDAANAPAPKIKCQIVKSPRTLTGAAIALEINESGVCSA